MAVRPTPNDFYTYGVGACSRCWGHWEADLGPDGEPVDQPPLLPEHKVGGARINGQQVGGRRCEGSGEELWGWRATGQPEGAPR